MVHDVFDGVTDIAVPDITSALVGTSIVDNVITKLLTVVVVLSQDRSQVQHPNQHPKLTIKLQKYVK